MSRKAPFPSFRLLICFAVRLHKACYVAVQARETKRDCDTPNTMKFSAALMVDSNKDDLETAQENVDKQTVLHVFSISTHEEDNKELAEILSQTVHSKYGSGMIIDGSPCQGLSAANATRERSDTRNLLYVAGGRLGLSSDIYIKENSPEVLSYDKYGKFFAQELGQLFADAGFQIGIYVLSGPFFGIPQTRTRAFFVAIKSGRSFIKNGILATHAVLPTPKSNTRWSPSFLKVTQDLKPNCNGTKDWLEKSRGTSLDLQAPVSVYDCLKHLVDTDLRKSTGHFVKDSITANTRNNHADNNNGNDSQNVCRKPDNTLPKDYYPLQS